MSKPLISIIMPVYNAESFLREAIESILAQTYTNFEFLILNDGSTDNSLNIIKSYSDDRIKLISNSENKGIAYTLNYGIKIALGEYIARMDADDISLPERLFKQITFLEEHPEVVLCGTWYTYFGKSEFLFSNISTHEEIYTYLLFIGNPIGHPTVVFRKKIFLENNLYYNLDYTVCQDYLLWVEMVDFFKFYIFPESLLKYRWSNQNICFSKIKLRIKESNQVKKIGFKKLLKRDLLKEESMAIDILDWWKDEKKNLTLIDFNHMEILISNSIKSNKFIVNRILKLIVTDWEKMISKYKIYYLKKIFTSPIIKYSNYNFRDRLFLLRGKA